jgi:hypothetical protein
MAIVSGSSTITGLASLPDNSVGTNALASGAVTQAKLGVGAVVQTQVLSSTAQVSIAPGNTLTEVSSSHRVSITPVYSNSLIVVTYHIPWSWTSWAANYVCRVSAKRWISGSVGDLSSVGTTNGSRIRIAGHAVRPSNGYDGNDMNWYSFTTMDLPGTTSAVQYGYYVSTEAGTMVYGYSGNNGAGFNWSSTVQITAQEIKQ